MPDTDLQIITLPALTSKDLLARVERIHEVQQKVMKRDVDYGIIPGCQKPSLYKSGAEILLQTFELASLPEQDDVQDLGNADEIRYRVVVPITHIPTGRVVGNGVGECSSNEDKYKWRKMVCEQEFEETDPARRRIVWKHGHGGQPYQVKQIRTNPSDLANTILKMAKKRGLVDGTMTVTAASRNFTQDVEDLPREYLDQSEPVRSSIPQVRPRNDATMVQPATDKYTGEPVKPAADGHEAEAQAPPVNPVSVDAPPAQSSAKAFCEEQAAKAETNEHEAEGYIGTYQPRLAGKQSPPGRFVLETMKGEITLQFWEKPDGMGTPNHSYAKVSYRQSERAGKGGKVFTNNELLTLQWAAPPQ